MEITQTLCPSDKWNIKAPYAMTPTRIVVHNTANDASAMSEISYMNSNNNYVSFHYAVDDYRAVQGLPLDRNGWHAGDGVNGVGNRQGIGIEICYSKSGGNRFTLAEQNAAKLCAYLLKQYNWGVDRIVTKHQDYDGKYCPHRTLDLGWQRFLDMIKFELNPSVPVPNAIKLDKPEKYKTNFNGVKLWDLNTNPHYSAVKEFEKGAVLEFYAYIPFNNTKYLVTEYSFSKGIKNGVNIADLTLCKPITEPEPEKPTPNPETPPTPPETDDTKPQPTIEPEPVDEPKPEPTEPDEPKDEFDDVDKIGEEINKEVEKSWLMRILNFIINLIIKATTR